MAQQSPKGGTVAQLSPKPKTTAVSADVLGPERANEPKHEAHGIAALIAKTPRAFLSWGFWRGVTAGLVAGILGTSLVWMMVLDRISLQQQWSYERGRAAAQTDDNALTILQREESTKGSR